MKLSNRLITLERHQLKMVYPNFSDMYDLHTKELYVQWLLDHNTGLTRSMIEQANIKSLNDMYV